MLLFSFSAGLCETCLHQRVIRNTRGSSFSLCERSKDDPAFPKYPRLTSSMIAIVLLVPSVTPVMLR